MLKFRLIYGTLMVAALVGLAVLDERLGAVALGSAVTLPPGIALLGLTLVACVIACRELMGILVAKGLGPRPLLAQAGVAAAILAAYAAPMLPAPMRGMAVGSVLVAVFALALVCHSVPGQRTQGAVAAACSTLFAVIYLGVLPGFLFAIRSLGCSAYLVGGVLLVIKCCDIGAYTTGRLLGRNKLIPWLSPGKTREGLAGGLVLSGLVTLGLIAVSNRHHLAGVRLETGWFTTGTVGAVDSGTGAGSPFRFSLLWGSLAGVVLAALGHVGDLVASLFKRDAGLKDSGTLVPGFGGVIDVIDSPLLVAPAAYWLLALCA